MAASILIPLKAVFDNKGVRDAQKEFGKLGSSMKGVLATAGLAIGLGAITAGLKASAKAAVEDSKSQAILANQLKNTVGATDEQTAAVEQSIKQMQLMSSVADDDIRPAFATLLRSTKDVGQATALTTLALDVAAGTGKDLGSVSQALGKAIGGSTTSLLKLIPSLKNAKDPMGELQKQFGGMAETAANNDPFQRMNIIIGELQEQIGVYLMPMLNDFADWLASPLGQEQIAKIAQLFGAVAQNVGRMVSWLLDNTWLVKTVAGVALWAKAMGTVFAVAKGIYAVIKATAIGEYITKAVSSSKTWVQALALGGTAAATGIAAFAVTDAMIGSIDTKVENLAASVGTLTDFTLDPNLIPEVDTTGTKPKVTKPADKARQAMLAALKKAADEARQAFESLKAGIEDFNKSFVQTAKDFQDAFKPSPALGEFEQQAVDAFTNIKNAAAEAFDNGLIEAKSLASLNAYADREKALLVGIAKQRDVLAKKITIAQSVTSGVMGSLNINSMLETQTKQVTKSVTRMVNGIALTTSQTFDEVVSGGLADSFKKLVDRTKTFAANLTKLKSLGLNGNLFKQIVEGGAEAGNATAEAIIAGGAGAVKELNGLFGELEKAGTDIAATSTPILYALGEDITNSFIDGLRSEDQKLIDTASAMAALFTSQFKMQLDSAMGSTLGIMQATGISAQRSLDLTSRPDPKRSPQSYATWLDSIGGIDPVRSPQAYDKSLAATTYNVTINANAITDKQSLPALVTDALVTASKQGLTGGLSRLLTVQ